jgi:hypothetical protein
MPLKKLPDGQMVNTDLVESVEIAGPHYTENDFEVIVKMKGDKQVVIQVDSKKAQTEMLAKVADCLGV